MNGMIFLRLHKPVVLCGDFNAQHFLWGSNFSDKYSINMSVVDLSLCSQNFAHRTDWNVCDDSLGWDLSNFDDVKRCFKSKKV